MSTFLFEQKTRREQAVYHEVDADTEEEAREKLGRGEIEDTNWADAEVETQSIEESDLVRVEEE